MLFEIWTKKQRDKFFEIPGFWEWFAACCVVTWLAFITFITSIVYVCNVADAVVIFVSYHIFVPVFGLLFKTGAKWKHRYFLCLLMVIVGIFLMAQPSAVFGYSINIDSTDQLIGVILSLSSAIVTAFVTVGFTMIKKLAYLDLMKQSAEQYVDIFDENDSAKLEAQLNDKTPLLSAGIYNITRQTYFFVFLIFFVFFF